jgi:hypothetical protein
MEGTGTWTPVGGSASYKRPYSVTAGERNANDTSWDMELRFLLAKALIQRDRSYVNPLNQLALDVFGDCDSATKIICSVVIPEITTSDGTSQYSIVVTADTRPQSDVVAELSSAGSNTAGSAEEADSRYPVE